METNELIKLCIQVISDWKVYCITILTFGFIAIGNYTINYRKKPPKLKKIKKASPPPKPAEPPAEAKSEGEG